MAASTNKTWRLAPGVAGSWATAGNWSNDDGTQSTVIPSAAAVVTINGSGNITLAGQTCSSLIINGNTTFIGTGLTVSNDVTINGAITFNHSGTGSLSVGRNFTNTEGQFNQTQTTTGLVTFNGAQAASVNLGSHSTRAITIAKTVNSVNSAITFNSSVSCELTTTTASVFTFTSGYLINYFNIYARVLNNASTTARSWDMQEDLTVTLGAAGTAISAAQTTCTFVNRKPIRLNTSNTSGTITATFGAGPPSTCPFLVLDYNTNYALSGSFWDLWTANGTHTGTVTLTVFSVLHSGGYSATWTTVTINLVSSSSTVGNYTDSYVRFGTITCPGSWVSGTTYTGAQSYINFINVTCNTLNLNGIQAYYLIQGGTVYTNIIFSSTSGSTSSELDLIGGTAAALTLSTNVNNVTYNKSGGFSVTGTTTFNTGTLNLVEDFITGSFTSTGTLARTFDWTRGRKIYTTGAGTISLTLSTNCTIQYTGDYAEIGGFVHQGTGTATGNAATWTGTPRMKTWAASSCTWTTWYTNDLEIVDGCQIGSASTINFTRNFTGYTSLNMAGLTVNNLFSDASTSTSTVDYSGSAIAAFNHAIGSVIAYINQLTAVNITLSGASTTYNLGVIDVSSMSLNTTGTIALSGTGSTYNLNSVRGYNLTLSSTGTYNCYDYSHNYYTNPPTAGTVTHTAGTLILKSTPVGVDFRFQMVTWSFTSTTGTRGITFENGGWIQTLNTGALSVNYTSLTSSCTETDNSGFYHNGSGNWQLGPAAPSSPAAALNLVWTARVTVVASYVKNLGNYELSDGYKIGCGLLNNTAAVSVSVSGNILFTGNAFSEGVIQSDSKWQWLNLTYWGADATRTCTYTTGASEFGEGGVFRAFGPLTLAATFTGTLKLNTTLAVASAVHQGGTLDVYGNQLTVTTSYTSTDGTVNKYITNTAATSANPDIYITATSGTPWSFAYSSLLYSYNNVWIYIRGGTVSHGATARQTTYQPSFDLTERVTAYTLAPTTSFQVGGLRINNYTVPTNSVWTIAGPEFKVYTGGLTAPASFTVNITNSGRSNETCQMYCDNTSFIWPTVNFTGTANIANSGWQFKTVNINSGASVTCSSGQTVYVSNQITSTDYFGGTLNISGSTWVLYGANPIVNDFYARTQFTVSSDLTGTLNFAGLNGTNLGNQSATFFAGFGGKILNNISYNTGTQVGALSLTTILGYPANSPIFGQFDFGYNTAKVIFGASNASGNPVPVTGSKFNLGTSSAGTRYIQSIGVGWDNWGLKNIESSSIVTGDYLNVLNCPVTGGGGWYAGNNSVNGGGNTGWIFTAPPTYQLTSSTASVNEGATLTITLATTNLSNGTTVAYTITGATSEDLNGASLTGNFTISSGSASLVLSIANDYLTEGNETLTLALDNGGASISVTIIDTSLTRTYSLSRSAASVTEGSTFTITLTTTNVTNSTLVPYTISGTGLTTNDFAALLSGYTSRGTWSASTAYVTNDVVIYLGNMYRAIASSTNQIPSATLGTYWNSLVGSFTGNFTITNNTNAITFLTNWDYSPESTETLTLALDNGLSTVSVDIANLLNPTYALTTTALSLNEGGNFTITLTTTDVPNNTLVPYTITGVASADINGASLTGNFTVSSNTAIQTFTVTADYVTEGNETFVLTLNSIGTNVSVLLIDYTKTRTYSLSTDATSTVYEGGSFIITLTTTNVFDGTLVPYTITGVTSADINNASLTGNFTINSGVGTQSFTTTIDGIVEGVEVFTLTLDSPATGSINVSISDPISAGGGNSLLLFD